MGVKGDRGEMDDRTIFKGERMKALRIKENITQEALANAINVSRTQIANLELGNSEPSLHSLVALAIALDCSTDYLLGISAKRFVKTKDFEPLPFE